MNNEEKKFTHPSYGKITVGKPRGGSCNLFMSDMKHNETIRVEIREAHMTRHLSHDWLGEGKLLLTFEMSAAQWANFVSSFSSGTGTPITFEYKEGARVEACPAPPQVFHVADTEIRERTARATERAAKAEKILRDLTAPGTKPPSKQQLKDALTEVRMAIQDMRSNLPFVADSFKEKMETVLTHAQIEFESYKEGRLRDLGLEALAKGAPVLKFDFGEIEKRLAAAGELDEFIPKGEQ